MKILGIETSCDETAAAVVQDGKTLLSNVVASSMDIHTQYGGVVPEIAARSHIEAINPVINQALTDAKCTWSDINGIAVTYGAGLGGSLLIGVLAARTAAIIHKKPLYEINHVEGHVYANFLTSAESTSAIPTSKHGENSAKTNDWKLADKTYTLPQQQPKFPLLALIVSGNHSQLVTFTDHFKYTLLGRTGDDAIGEAFDKVARVLGLPYPGGPNIAKVAKNGDPKFQLPKAKLTNKYDFSFSGLKTAVLRLAQKECGKDYTFPSFKLSELLSERQKADIAASFQRIAVETVVDKTIQAYEEFSPKSVVIAGGVAANQELRQQLQDRLPIQVNYTDIKLCTDNGAMIATLGCFKAIHDQPRADPYSLDIQPNLKM